MKVAEKIFAILLTIGILMKLFLIVGGSILIVTGSFLLALMYQFLSFAYFNEIQLKNIFKKQSYQGLSAMRIIGTIVLGFVLSNAVLGILFKIQFYAGAGIMLFSGVFSLLICLIIVLARYNKNKPIGYKKILTRIIIVGVFSILLMTIPSFLLREIFYRDHPSYVQALRNLRADPENEELEDEAQRQWEILQSDSSYIHSQ